ncbi:MAG: type II toxin-antitoxin system mRNA interferase toxin, RelE/StbE family [Nitrosotalea sp.]
MRLVQPSDKLLKKLKKFKSDKTIIEGYQRILEDLEAAKDPTKIGERKHGLYANCYAIHVTKNHSLVYMYLTKEDVVILIDLDDHKNLYGRDDRS